MRTTAAHYKLFKKTVAATAVRLGLTDWDFRLGHEHRVNGALATVYCDVPNRIATIVLGRDWKKDEVTTEMIKISAVHEVLHVLLADMCDLGASRSATKDAFEQAEHAVIRRLEKLL